MKFCYVVYEEVAKGPIFDIIYDGGVGKNPDNRCVNDQFDQIQKCGFFADREHVENMPFLKQIIPCFTIVDKKNNMVLLYRRKGNHTEKRLATLWSACFGGHIDPEDWAIMKDSKDIIEKTINNINISPIISVGLAREALEETGIVVDKKNLEFNGFIYDNKDSVGKVHLGVHFIIEAELTEKLLSIISSKPEIGDVLLVSVNDMRELLRGGKYELEGWAELLLENFIKKYTRE